MTYIIISNPGIIDGSVPLEKLEGATEIEFNNCKDLTAIPQLPNTLEILYLSGCANLESIPEELPNTLEILYLSGCANLESIPEELPNTLKKLNLSGCAKLKNLPELPNTLKILDLSCTNLESLPKLPKDLKKLNLSGCAKLKNLPELPNTLKELDLIDCVLELPKLPNGLEILNLSKCTNLESLPKLPKDLKKLNLSGCAKLKNLPELPNTLKELYLIDCVLELPKLPNGLEILNLSKCANLTSLPELPNTLKILDLSKCSKLETLPELPDCLGYLNLSGCDKLQPTLQLLEKLSALEEKGCQVFYPRHFSHDSLANNAKKRLDDLIKKYTENQENEHIDSSFITGLFRRYLTEGISQRIAEGSLAQKARIIVKSTQPFLDFIEKNPNSLSWIGDVCVDHQRGCVNQSVFAFAKINALIEIAKQEALIDKINNSKYFITLGCIIAKVNQKSPGPSFEAEATNMVLIDLHKELLARNLISTPWEGVPEKIANESFVKAWFDSFISRRETDELIQSFQDLDAKRCAEILCDVYHEKWYKIAFSDDPEIKRAKAEYESLANESGEHNKIQELIDLKDQKDEKIINRTKALTLKALQESQTDSLSQTAASPPEIQTAASPSEISLPREGVRDAQCRPAATPPFPKRHHP